MSAFEDSILRVLRGNVVVGAAFLVSDSLVATCAHVVETAGVTPGERLSLRLSDGKEITGVVDPSYWRDPSMEDISILRLEEALTSIKPLVLGSSLDAKGHKFFTLGFPHNEQELSGNGEIIGQAIIDSMKFLQLDSKQVTPGFSGAPVFDEVKKCVVGMVAAIMPPDRYLRLSTTALSIPTEMLVNVCPDINPKDICPYRNLDAFDETDVKFFFGRQRVLDKLLESLKGGHHFLAILGPSGCGKSSIISAGLIPCIRNGKLPESKKWGIISVRPTSQPFEQLVIAGLDKPEESLVEAVRRWLDKYPDKTRLVLVIDQFEELLVNVPEVIRQAFIAQLAELLDSKLDISVLIVMRDDFYSRFIQVAEPLVKWLERNQVIIPPTITMDELRQIVVQPAKEVGLEFEEGLVETILADAMETKGNARNTILPLLEFTLTQLWESRHNGRLLHSTYRDLGKVSGGLALWADRTFSLLDKDDQNLAHRILTQLVHLGNTAQDLPDSKRRIPISRLYNNPAEEESVHRIVYLLADARLLATGRDEDIETAELIHDALIREWNQLRLWLSDDRQFLTWRQNLTERYFEWKNGRGEYLQGRELTIAQAYLEEREGDLSQVSEYISKSVSQEKRRRRLTVAGVSIALVAVSLLAVFSWIQRTTAVDALEKVKVSESTAVAAKHEADINASQAEIAKQEAERNAAQAEAAKLEADHNAAEAIKNAEEAQKQTLYAISDKLSSLALARIDTDYTSSLLLGTESYRLLEVNNILGGRNPDTIPSLLQKTPQGLTKSLLFPPNGTVWKITYSVDGRLMASASDTVDIWDTSDPKNPKLIKSFAAQGNVPASDVAFNHDGTLLAVGYSDSHAELFSVKEMALLKKISDSETNIVTSVRVAFSSSGKILVTSGDKKIRMWDVSNPNSPKEYRPLKRPHGYGNVVDLFFLPSYENYLVSMGEDNALRIWDLTSPEEPKSVNSLPTGDGVISMTVGGGKPYSIVLASNQFFYFYNSDSRGLDPYYYLQDQVKPVHAMVFNPVKNQLFTASDDGAICIWDVSNLPKITLMKKYFGHSNIVNSIAFHPSGNIIASGGRDSKIVIWSTLGNSSPAVWQNSIPVDQNKPADREITAIAYGPQRNYLAVGHLGGDIRIWNIEDSTNIQLWRSIPLTPFEPVIKLAFNSDETYLITLGGKAGSYPAIVTRRNITNIDKSAFEELIHPNTTDFFVFNDNFILGGEQVNNNINIHSWNISGYLTFSDLSMAPPKGPILGSTTCPAKNTASSPVNNLIAIASCDVQIWGFSYNYNTPPAMLIQEKTLNPQSVAFSRNGKLLASGSGDQSVSLWSISTGTGTNGLPSVTVTLAGKIMNAHQRLVTGVAFSPDGKTLATAGDDQTIILWDISNLSNPIKRLALTGHTDKILNGAILFTNDGKVLISASRYEVILWDTDPKSWVKKACDIAGRNLTHLEWNQFIGENIPYHATCPDLPIPTE